MIYYQFNCAKIIEKKFSPGAKSTQQSSLQLSIRLIGIISRNENLTETGFVFVR